MNDLNKIELGRSMVEMLGVLAIIGVLSVGGISGYTTAMNKHKANEILNAAAVRAMAVSTQLQSGVTDPTLGEFDSAEKIGGATFTGVDKVGDNQFKLTFGDKPSDAVLAQMQNIAGDNVGVDGSRLLYNNDLSTPVTNTNNRDENDPTKCAVGYVLPDCDTCAEGYEKQSDGTCIIPTPTHNCPSGATLEEGYTGSDALGDGKCKCSFSNNNSTCGGKDSGYYCNLEGKVTPTDSWEDGSCYTFRDGTCQAVSGLKGSGNYTNTEVNWYTGYSFCQGLGKDMVTGRGNSEVSCTGDFQRDENNDNYGSCTTSLSAPSYYWLDTCTDDATKSCSSEQTCGAFRVGSVGDVNCDDRSNTFNYALCE